MCVCIYIYTYGYVYICICICIYIYIYKKSRWSKKVLSKMRVPIKGAKIILSKKAHDEEV